MTDFLRPTRLDHTGALCALRKVAVLTHWIPGVGTLVRQEGRLPVRVAAFAAPHDGPAIDIDPCSFRRTLVGWLSESCCGLARLFVPHDGVVIRVFTDDTTMLSESGIVRHRLRDDAAVLAFATLVSRDRCRTIADDTGAADGRPMRIDFTSDEQLGVTLVHTMVDPRDEAGMDRAVDTLIELTAALGAAEAVDQFEHIAGR